MSRAAYTAAAAARDKEKIPTLLLRAMLTLVLCSLLIVAYARLTDRPLEATPPTGIPVIKERSIILSGGMNGAAQVLDLDGSLIASLTPEEGGFISGVYRVLAHERKKIDAPRHAPVRLVAYEDGRLALFDDLTGWRAELIGFGRDNYAAFARLLNP
ncbi:MAG: photosynthetic complex assembly protein PuhC [Pseudomonadota bacterium]